MNYKQLKTLAILCMVFDHAVRIFPLYRMFAPLADWLWARGRGAAADWLLDGLPLYLMLIGRLAAPIFLFCIAQGLLHTRDVKSYLRRILLTALAAQVPYALFDLAVCRLYGMAETWGWQDVGLNICFTLALGLAALAVYRHLAERVHPLSWVVVCAAATALARLLSMEGSRGYILLIFTFYLTRNRPRWQRALWFLPAVVLSRWGLVQWVLEDFTTGAIRNCLLNMGGNYLGMVVTLAYNGEKGAAGRGFQRFMYAFYPAHFALLALISLLLPPLV
ncbi:MAG: hypothetical protein HFG12_03765 [Oscillibacter sp.]|jgi:hypothetical protein|nr:TraX family protein [uncultured Oscillibacter sp.]MCI8812345.1 hypothetical protein [Oscillibacter sp.]